MALSYDEFVASLAETEKALKAGIPVEGISSCPDCSVPLQESVTGSRKIGEAHFCSDCYYERLGNELEANPVFMPRASHRA